MTQEQFKFSFFVAFVMGVMVLSAYRYSTPSQDFYKLFIMLAFLAAVVVLPVSIIYAVVRKKKNRTNPS